MFSKRKCKLQGLSKDSKLQAYLNELSANVLNHGQECYACLLDQCIQCLYSKINLDNYPKSIKDINDPWGKKFSLEIKI
jgi:hypothetical protein